MGEAFRILVPWSPQVGPADEGPADEGLADEGNPALAFVPVLVVDRDTEDAQVGALASGGPSL